MSPENLIALATFMLAVLIGLFKLAGWLIERVRARTKFEDRIEKSIGDVGRRQGEFTKRLDSIERAVSNLERRQSNIDMLQLGRAVAGIPEREKQKYPLACQVAQAIIDRYSPGAQYQRIDLAEVVMTDVAIQHEDLTAERNLPRKPKLDP